MPSIATLRAACHAPAALATLRTFALPLALGAASLLTAHSTLADDAPWSMAMGQWKPTRDGECSQAIHDSYSLVSPDDGKRYPTWHPPVDPDTGCFFGHEHGADPSTSPLSDWGPVLFGYVNEQAMAGNVHRHEDHVGHKVTVIEDVVMNPSGLHGPAEPLTCQVLAKLHQGTHSADAFTNNLHEQLIRMSCSDGSAFDLQMLSQIGAGGGMQKQCSAQDKIQVGIPTPANSPVAPTNVQRGGSMGNRFLPTNVCAAAERPNLFEIWKTQNGVAGLDGTMKLGVALYWGVENPARYYDPEQANKLSRTSDLCWMQAAPGQYLVISNPCVTVRKLGNTASWNDEASPFKGTQRRLRVDSFTLRNGGPNDVPVWYTDVYGLNASLAPFPGSVRQAVVKMSHTPNQYSFGNSAGGVNGTSGGGLFRDFNAPGVHAPN